jgi:uncharacterized protein (TIGR01244 family)
MKIIVFAIFSGGLFGAGLLIAGMTNTKNVQDWLDVFGNRDPTLDFILAGAVLPMMVAWRIAARRKVTYLGLNLPRPASQDLGADLTVGSVLFGAGWALVGLCPGTALASLSYGGFGGVIFLFSMLIGMVAAPYLRRCFSITAPSETSRSKMDIRALTPTYAVSPQIDLSDLPAIKAAGFGTVIDNRPDGEIPSHLHTPHMQAAAEAIGLKFIANPVIGGAMTMENIRLQAEVMAEATGAVFAYCASGNRCSVVWAMMNAGSRSTDDLIRTPAKFGYNLEPLRGQIDALAAESAQSED